MAKEDLYAEDPARGRPHRVRMLEEVRGLIRREQGRADRRRRAFFRPDVSSPEAYANSLGVYREKLRQMLGWPLTAALAAGGTRAPKATVRAVARDALGSIDRIWIETLPGLRTYGLFFRPPGPGPFPFAVAQHGARGTPELCSGFFGSANYNDMVRRVLRRRIAVFAPQLLLWVPESPGPLCDKERIDRQLRQLGGSLVSLDLLRIIRAFDYFARRPEIDAGRMGMIGLSFGGFYTLFAAALDPRIRVAVASCFFNNRKVYNKPLWTWQDAANRFLDAEVACLVCPRPLYLEWGADDSLSPPARARSEARKVAAMYDRLGLSERFCQRVHAGGHELDPEDPAIDFLAKALGAGPVRRSPPSSRRG